MVFLKKYATLLIVALVLNVSTAAAHDNAVSTLKVSNAWARATVAMQKSAGAFMTLNNTGPADKLISASTPVAETTALHSMSMEGDVMKMKKIDAVDLPANSQVMLKPGGMHIMFFNIKKQFKPGEHFPP